MSMQAVSDITRGGVSAFSAGGNAPVTINIAVTPAKYYEYSVGVTAIGVTVSSLVRCYIRPNADWDADELGGFDVIATPGANNIVFTITAPGVFVGNFAIVYTIEV